MGAGALLLGLGPQVEPRLPLGRAELHEDPRRAHHDPSHHDGGNIYAADDPELHDYPLAYLCEPGFWNPTESEVAGLRDYLLKGGFLVIDDFADLYLRGPQFKNFERQMRRVLPGHKLIQLDPSHPVFQTFFKVEDLDFTHPKLPYLDTLFYGVFENNDPTGG